VHVSFWLGLAQCLNSGTRIWYQTNCYKVCITHKPDICARFLEDVIQIGQSPGELGKAGKVTEFKSGQGKVMETWKSQGKCGQLPRVLILTQNVQKRNYLLAVD